ncbi:MAG: ABC transporter ATP-binding protein [Pseudomonadota bacterium]
MLTLESLVSGYSNTRGVVVGDVSLTLPAGAFVCVIGRNGAGKSTLMRTISGLQSALSGTVLLNGLPIAEMSAIDRARAVSVVTTERVSSPGMRALDVVQLGRQPFTDWRGQLEENDHARVAEALAAAGASHFAPLAVDSLSDGERQRVMIARALAQASRVMVLDEITAFLDLPGRVEMMALLRRHARETGKIVLLSSHDLELSLELAEYLWIVDDGVLKHGSPDELMASGALGHAFDSHDVAFDSAAHRFRLRATGA